MTVTNTTADLDVSLDDEMAGRAAQRLAETLALNIRLVDGPLYRLVDIQPGRGAIRGTAEVTRFVRYALTMDLLEGELVDVIAANAPMSPDALPLRDAYLPDVTAVLNLPGRLCAGGTLALCAIARPADPFRGPADYVLLVQERSGHVVNAARRLAVIPKGFHEPMTDYRADAHLGATLRREMEEELFGRDDIDSTAGQILRADPMHPSRLSEPMRWLMDHPDQLRMECTGFGLNLVSGNFEFPGLIVIDDEDFYTRFGGQIEANWEATSLRQYSSLDRDLLSELAADETWSNEGLFAFLQGLRRLSEVGGDRVNAPTTPLCDAPASPAPQPRHRCGSCRTISSGSATCANVDPGCPACPPGLRPVLPRNDFRTGLANPSDEGGWDELVEFIPNRRRNSTFSASNATTRSRSSPISRACSTTRAASS